MRSGWRASTNLPQAYEAPRDSARSSSVASQPAPSSTSLFRIRIHSPLLARIPALTAGPNPAFLPISITRAPPLAATAAESSVLPLSTTIISETESVWARKSSNTFASRADPFQLGMTTLTRGIAGNRYWLWEKERRRGIHRLSRFLPPAKRFLSRNQR